MSERSLPAEPLDLLQDWLEDARAAGSLEPHAMSLCTVAGSGSPSARMVLLRRADAGELVFFTSYFSQKGEEIEANSRVAAVFYWPEMRRQVRVEGVASRVAEEESDAYFAGRPRGHQLGAWASEQSKPIDDREMLDQRMSDYAARFEDQEVPRPHSWGGYAIRPNRFEFWQGRDNRMHDRIAFERDGAAWVVRRLQP